jgi:hypothetical protein
LKVIFHSTSPSKHRIIKHYGVVNQILQRHNVILNKAVVNNKVTCLSTAVHGTTHTNGPHRDNNDNKHTHQIHSAT